jgi:acetoin utilization deacetylase AcuC-like enzyme
MEGGYAVEQVGVNAVNVLTGFEGRVRPDPPANAPQTNDALIPIPAQQR